MIVATIYDGRKDVVPQSTNQFDINVGKLVV